MKIDTKNIKRHTVLTVGTKLVYDKKRGRYSINDNDESTSTTRPQQPQQARVVGDFKYGFAKVKSNRGWNYIDRKGALLSPSEWFSIVSDFIEGFGIVCSRKHNDGCNFINTKGEIISPRWFHRCYAFSDGCAAVENYDRHWNYINVDGQLISPYKWFDFAGDFHDGFGECHIGRKTYKIDCDGSLYRQPKGLKLLFIKIKNKIKNGFFKRNIN